MLRRRRAAVDGRKSSRPAGEHRLCVDLAGLITDTTDQRVPLGLPDVLGFSGVGLQLAAIIKSKTSGDCGSDLTCGISAQSQGESRRIGLSQCIIQSAGQDQCVASWTPLMMVTGKNIWLLLFRHAQGLARSDHARKIASLIVVL